MAAADGGNGGAGIPSGATAEQRVRRNIARQQKIADAARHYGQSPLDLGHEIIVDLFAGGGGYSEGVLIATGREPDVAVNHDTAAIGMHIANHPSTRHYIADVREVDPREAVGGRAVGLLHGSPDCTFFSTARGAAPLRTEDSKVRMLPWILWKWAKLVRPRVITAENVCEIANWGPVVAKRDDRSRKVKDRSGNVLFIPDPKRKGEYYRKFIAAFRKIGYQVETRELHAHDYGCGTRRRRWFMIARCDGLPIVWPEKTHGPGRQHPYVQTAECLDFEIPTRSIFDRKKPMAENSLRRIANGVIRYVIENPDPYIIGASEKVAEAPILSTLNHTGADDRGQSVRDPINTILASRDARALLSPILYAIDHASSGPSSHYPVTDTLSTITTENRHALAVVEAEEISAANLVKYYGTGGQDQAIQEPAHTITTKGRLALVESTLSCSHISKYRGDSIGSAVTEPVPTITSGASSKRAAGAAHALGMVETVIAPEIEIGYMAQHNAGGYKGPGSPLDVPLSSITTTGSQQQLVAATLTAFYGSNERGSNGDLRQPVGAITAGGQHQGLLEVELAEVDARAGRVVEFLKKYYTPPKRARKGASVGFDPTAGVVTVNGRRFRIIDIKCRMLEPRELYTCTSFGADYIIDPVAMYKTDAGNTKIGPLPKSEQVAKVGNSVPPLLAAAIVKANFYHEAAMPAADRPSVKRTEVGVVERQCRALAMAA